MNKSTLQDALAMFERLDIPAELEDDGTIHVMTSNPDVYVQISTQEVIWRADQYLETKKQEA
jgi:hypothetical protein